MEVVSPSSPKPQRLLRNRVRTSAAIGEAHFPEAAEVGGKSMGNEESIRCTDPSIDVA